MSPSTKQTLPEHLKYWFELCDKLFEAVVHSAELDSGLEGDPDRSNTDENQSDSTISELAKYVEVPLEILEGFYPPEDLGTLDSYVGELILWTQNTRSRLVEIQAETRELVLENDAKEAERAAIQTLEDQVRAIYSLLVEHQSPDAVQESHNAPETTTVQPDQATPTDYIEPSVPFNDMQFIIAQITTGLSKLSASQNANEIALKKLKNEVAERQRLFDSEPIQFRPVAMEDVHKMTKSCVNLSEIKYYIKKMLDNLSQDMDEIAQKVHEDLERPLRTIGLEFKRLKIPQAAIQEM